MRYTAYGYINMAVDVMGCLVILALIISRLINQSTQHAKSRVFVLLLIAAFLSIFCEFLSWMILDWSDPVLWSIYRTANFLAFFMEGCVLGLYMLYIYLYAESQPKAAFLLTCLCLTAVALYMLAIIASPFNGMLYSLDRRSGYQWGTYYGLGSICTFAAQACSAGVILLNRRALGMKRAVMLSSYILFPVIMAPVHLIDPDIPVSFAVMPLAMLMIYVDFQTQERDSLMMKLTEERAATMLSQIQPHFLFNSLMGIRQLCDTQPRLASEALEHFSCFLRRNLESLTKPGLIPFEQEMVYVEDYLYLEKMRFGEKLDIKLEIETKDFMLPPLTLQPIVENAVQHGIVKKNGRGTVTIKSSRQFGDVVITVTDNGVGFAADCPGNDGRLHVGIVNVKQRLELQCGGVLYMKSEKETGTEVTIVLPQ